MPLFHLLFPFVVALMPQVQKYERTSVHCKVPDNAELKALKHPASQQLNRSTIRTVNAFDKALVVGELKVEAELLRSPSLAYL